MRHLVLSGAFLAHLPPLFGQGLPYGQAYRGVQSRPLGSSFAPIGVDATYDYVVSTLPPVTKPRKLESSFSICKCGFVIELLLVDGIYNE